MGNGSSNAVYRQIIRVLRDGTLTGLSDQQILERYVEHRDEAAFETIVARHGSMVLNVCRQLLHEPLDVEDAFQAAFLALIRKADSIRVDDSLGPWLHTVAHRTAMRARAKRARRGAREIPSELLPERPIEERPEEFEISRVIHEELGRLPERLRVPIVLCYLQGASHEMAARQIRCPVGTVRSRLARARALLQKRMVRRGLTLSAGAFSALLESSAKAGSSSTIAPLHLKTSLVKMAARAGAAHSVDGIEISKRAIELGEGVLNVMRIKTLSVAAAGLASVGILLAIVGTTASSAADRPDEQQPVVELKPKPKALIDKQEEKPLREVFNRTYSVADLVLPTSHTAEDQQNPANSTSQGRIRQQVDMWPLIELITSTIEPGSWRAFNHEGQEVIPAHLRGEQRRKYLDAEPECRITPFFLSITLIIRAPEETHEKVAELLQNMRAVVRVREGKPRSEALEKQIASLRARNVSAMKTDSQATTASTPAVAPSPKVAPSTRSRIDQLLDELRQEVAKLSKK